MQVNNLDSLRCRTPMRIRTPTFPLRITLQGPKCVADEQINCPSEGTRVVTLLVLKVTLRNEHIDLRYP